MFNFLSTLFSAGSSLSGLSRFMTFALVILTFSMGVGLAVTIGERNTAQANLQSAKTQIKEKDAQLGEKKADLEQSQKNNSDCRAEIQSLNDQAAAYAASQTQKDKSAADQVEQQMASLPAAISSDRAVAATAAQTTTWLKSLFK